MDKLCPSIGKNNNVQIIKATKIGTPPPLGTGYEWTTFACLWFWGSSTTRDFHISQIEIGVTATEIHQATKKAKLDVSRKDSMLENSSRNKHHSNYV